MASRIDINKYLVNSKNKSYFVVGVTVIFIVLVILIGILPAYSAVASQNKENSKRTEVLDKLNNKIDTLRNLSSEFNANKDLIDKFRRSFPEDDVKQDIIIEDVTKLVERHGLDLESISFSEPERSVPMVTEFKVTRQVDSQIVSVSAQSSRENILSFIEDLETARRIYNLDGFIMTRKTGQELLEAKPGFDYKLTVTFEVYYWVTNSENVEQAPISNETVINNL